MAYEKYNIRQFMDAWFSKNYSVIQKEEFDIVYSEYIDTAGLFQSEEFERVSYIHYINNRINSIKLAIKLQKEFLNNFDLPYIDGLKFFKKFGHILHWDNVASNFLISLSKIENKEKKYISIVENKIKELVDLRAKNNSKETNKETSRGNFIKTVNSLGKIGYKIEMDKTTVEELAWMIKQQFEEINLSKSGR